MPDNTFFFLVGGWGGGSALLSCTGLTYKVGNGDDLIWEVFCVPQSPFEVCCFKIFLSPKEALSDIETLSLVK